MSGGVGLGRGCKTCCVVLLSNQRGAAEEHALSHTARSRPIQDVQSLKKVQLHLHQSFVSTNSMLGTIDEKHYRTRAALRKVQVRGVLKAGLFSTYV